MDCNTRTKDELRSHQRDLTALQSSRQLTADLATSSGGFASANEDFQDCMNLCDTSQSSIYHLQNSQMLNEDGIDVSFALVLVAVELCIEKNSYITNPRVIRVPYREPLLRLNKASLRFALLNPTTSILRKSTVTSNELPPSLRRLPRQSTFSIQKHLPFSRPHSCFCPSPPPHIPALHQIPPLRQWSPFQS